MVLWPALTLLGFLVLTALVITMGTQSTARYEREQRAERTSPARSPDPAGAVAAGEGTPQPVLSQSESGAVSSTVRSNDASRSNRWCTRGSSHRQK